MTSLGLLIREESSVTGPDGTSLSASALRATGLIAPDPAARVALILREPLDVIRAIAALDGQVAAMLILSGSLGEEAAGRLVAQAQCGVVLTDREDLQALPGARPLAAALGPVRETVPVATQWLMTTSGTTGLPKIVPHTLRSLSRSVFRFASHPLPDWGLLYDPTRFAGMQVVLQALIGGGRLIVVDTHAPLGAQVAFMAGEGVTHLSATPTLWRRLLMVPGHPAIPLRQATLGGEIADQPILSALGAAYPAARLSHIYASTEAGVGFSVTDRQAGFPESYLETTPGGVRLKIVEGILWLRAPGPAVARDLPGIEVDEEGFVRSGDQVEARDGRIVFLGRDSGLINVGGVKIHPERVEAVIASVPGVVLTQIVAKKSPLTGALVVAEVQSAPGIDQNDLKRRILETCRARLEREAVPAILRFVDGFETNAAGKLVRTGRVSG